MGKIEDAMSNAGLGWTLCLVGEDQSNKLATLTNDLRGNVSTTGNAKKISSGFSYWGISPTLAWTRACSDPFYMVMKESIETFPDRFTQILPHGTNYHYVSLGVGTGHKDRQILTKLYKEHSGLFYFPVDMSPEMLRIGTQEAVKGIPIGRCNVLPIQIDFSLVRNVEKSRRLFNQIVGDEPILFSLLGNTLANFEEDVTLLRTIARFLRPQDRLMLEVAYTDTLSVDVVQEATEEYSRSRAFREFVTSALLQNTNLCISIEDVSFDSLVEPDRAIQIKALYRNQTGSATKILLPDRSAIDFPVEDTIRLYLTRKYSRHGVETLLGEGGVSLLVEELSTFSSPHSSFHFGMSVMLLRPSPCRNARHWENTNQQRNRGSTLQEKIATNNFDVFLCYNGQDKAVIKKIGEQLKEHGVLPWLDEWQLRPGVPWQRLLEEQIEPIKAAAVFVGRSGFGPWQTQEVAALLHEFTNRDCPVIPVLLKDSPGEPQLPIFLRNMTWIDFAKNDPDPLKQLIWGITGEQGDSDDRGSIQIVPTVPTCLLEEHQLLTENIWKCMDFGRNDPYCRGYR